MAMKETIHRYTCDLCNKKTEAPMIKIGLTGMIDREFIDKHVCDDCLRIIISAWRQLGSIAQEKRKIN